MTTPHTTMAPDCDVVVIGGGPAGSTIAALLARQGRRVVMLEKAHHPRFHIGESLLPANGPLFDRLGVRSEVEAMGMSKVGVEFISPDFAHHSFVEFADAWDKSMPGAWQVRRSEFDAMLFRHAQTCGALTTEGCQVRGVQFDAEGVRVTAQSDDGSSASWRTRYVVDASGRDTLLANQLRSKQRNVKHNSAALFAHFRGAQRLAGRLEGNISIFWFEHGWFWFIPLADGHTSVGAVCWPIYLKTRDAPLEAFLLQTISLCPTLAERLRDAEVVPGSVHATGNYSYASDHASGERYVMLGDAYAFVDPVFSTGVYLAMVSAFEAAELVATSLDRPAKAAAARQRFETLMKRGPREFSWFIYRMTNPAMRSMFMHPRNIWRVKEALMSLLAGDIYADTPIWTRLSLFKWIYRVQALLSSRRSLRAWLARRRHRRDAGLLKDESVVVQ
ncbi:MAG: NAD(P)/FAD-dependent oxidoreductase [Rubrivivax sp.]